MPRFELRLLGSPQIVRSDGTPVDLPLGKPLAMLCFLALEPSAPGRSDLAAMLWPSSPESRAKASIRQALWLIRKHTDSDIVVEEAGELRLDPDIVALDLTTLESHLGADRLDQAFTLWDGGPLRGFEVVDAQPWVAWADGIRSRWEAHLGRALEERASVSTGTERVTWLERALDVRPYRIESWSLLVQAHVELRDLDAAEAALAALRPVADPEDDALVREAEERIRLLRRSAFGDPARRLVPEFVGRSEEFAALMAAWRSARSGRPRVMGISGPPGIGKTALAQEMLRHCEADGAVTAHVRAVRTESDLDLGVVASLVADLIRRPGAAGTSAASARILQGLVPSEADQLSESAPGSPVLADALGDLLAAVSDEQPIAILVDDAQWVDGPSALILLRAMRHAQDGAVLMLWTCRTNGAPSPGARALDDAVEASAARCLSLAPLTASQIEEMVALLLQDTEPQPMEELASGLYLASGGTPLHAVELLQELRDRGDLEWTEAGWALSTSFSTHALAGSLLETHRSRVEQLSPIARALGHTLATGRTPRARSELCIAAGLTEPACAAALTELVERNLVHWTRDDRLELAHESLADAFRRFGPGSGGEEGAEGDAPPATRIRGWLAAAAVLVALALGIAGLRAGRAGAERLAEPASPPFGGGALWVGSHNAWRGYRVTASPALEPADSAIVPEALSAHPMALDAGGAPLVAGSTRSDPLEPPDAVLLMNGRVDTLFSTPGEDVVRFVRPSLDAALLAVQNPDTSRYRMTAVRLTLGPSVEDGSSPPRDTVVLAAGPASYIPVAWSPDGRHVVTIVDHAWDTLLVMDPGGRRLHALPPPDRSLIETVPCGPGRVLAASLPDGGAPHRWFWTFGDTAVATWAPTESVLGSPTCSPDGSVIAYTSQESDRTILILEDLEGQILLREDMPGATWVRWFVPSRPVPVRVEIRDPSLALDRGRRDTLQARILSQDSIPLERTLEWISDHPALASVDELGIVTANRPGTTVVRARLDGWLEDSVVVTVREADLVERLAFADSFPTLDPDVWVVAGTPDPIPVQLFDGTPALRLRGDGSYSDRIDTVEDFDLGRGATLEARFRFDSLQRQDRQRFAICLIDGDGRGDGELRRRQQQCLQWPAGEGLDFRRDAVRFARAGVLIGDIPVGELIRPGEWSTLALQVEADGRVQAVVNDSVIATHPARLTVAPDVRFHISISHASVDTELLLRDVLLWTEPRYR